MNKRQPKETSPEVLAKMKEIGLKIRQVRQATGINSVEFCKLHSINRMTLYRIENGEDSNISSFLHILDVIGVSLEEFFKEKN